MFTSTKGLHRIVPAIALGCLVAAGPAWAAPGDPFGDDDTGCAPTTKQGLSCAKKVHSLVNKLRRTVLKCHLTHATHAFKNGMGTPGFSNAEENCEIGPSATSAKAKFDDKIASLAAVCDATVIANANARRDVILGDQNVVGSLDNLNSTFFCDPTSGNLIDPGGDDGGYIPANDNNYKCSVVVAKLWSKLDTAVYKCHTKMAASVWAGKPFDEEACEDTGIKSALARYDTYLNKYITAGICPPCLTDAGPTNAAALGTSTVADGDAQLGEVYVCPGP
jgi:hypothetical protein